MTNTTTNTRRIDVEQPQAMDELIDLGVEHYQPTADWLAGRPALADEAGITANSAANVKALRAKLGAPDRIEALTGGWDHGKPGYVVFVWFDHDLLGVLSATRVAEEAPIRKLLKSKAVAHAYVATGFATGYEGTGPSGLADVLIACRYEAPRNTIARMLDQVRPRVEGTLAALPIDYVGPLDHIVDVALDPLYALVVDNA
jgi:hypothetical protein